jgi:hypothetical protein
VQVALTGGGSTPAGVQDFARRAQPLSAPSLSFPKDGSTNERLTSNTLSWAGTAVQNDIYFGATSPPPLVTSNLNAGFYALPQLNPCSTCYWKVVAKDSTGSASSPTWSFTTTPSVSPLGITQPGVRAVLCYWRERVNYSRF